MSEIDDFVKLCIELENKLILVLSEYPSDRIRATVLIEILISIIKKQENPINTLDLLICELRERCA